MRVRSLLLVAAAAGAVWTSGCAKGNQGGPKGPPPLAVDVGKATRQDIATYITLDGQVAPLQESVLSLPQSGVLVGVYANEGQRVRAGQVLAKIDDATFRAQLANAQAQVASAEATLQGSTLTTPITQQQTSSAVVQAEQQVVQAQNSLIAAQSAYQTAKTQYNSNSQLFPQGYVAQTTLDQSRSQYVAAQQQLNSARSSVQTAQSNLVAAKRNTGQTQVQQADTAAKSGALAAAQAQVKLLQTEIAQTTLSAPYGGVITQRLLDPGALASPNQPIMRISQVDTVYVNANVPDDSLAYVNRGTPVTFTSSSIPGKTFHGAVSDVNATPTQGTLSYRARLRQPNPGDELRGGMLVTVTVRKEYHKAAIVVPRTAVFSSDTGSSIYTVADGKAKALPVRVGLQTDTLAEISGVGVQPGTVVITTRPDALQDGSVVAIGGQPGAPPAGAPAAASAAPTSGKK
ncbi:MAG: efflux RND transporter periplasmic adaptor subunit [Candidatus Baltobacteraceae bacterium]